MKVRLKKNVIIKGQFRLKDEIIDIENNLYKTALFTKVEPEIKEEKTKNKSTKKATNQDDS